MAIQYLTAELYPKTLKSQIKNGGNAASITAFSRIPNTKQGHDACQIGEIIRWVGLIGESQLDFLYRIQTFCTEGYFLGKATTTFYSPNGMAHAPHHRLKHLRIHGHGMKCQQRPIKKRLKVAGKYRVLCKHFIRSLGGSDTMAYLSMIAPRIVELHRVLKPTGSIYLHCDPAASHYIRLLMDAIFHSRNFRNEIIWKRTSAHNDPRKWGRVHDVIFYYTKSDEYTWNVVHQAYDEQYLKDKYRFKDERGLYRLSDLTGAGVTRDGSSSRPWRDFDPSKIGRHWAIPTEIVESLIEPEIAKRMTAQEKLELLADNGFIYMTPRGRKGGVGFPQLKRHIGAGVPVQDFISDIPPINSWPPKDWAIPHKSPKNS